MLTSAKLKRTELLSIQGVDNDRRINVILFSGGRGSRVLSKALINHPRVNLTLAINGYDDGASTGEIRKFLGNSLGPSDFRKNANRLARDLSSCAPALVDLLDLRFPKDWTEQEAAPFLRLTETQNFPESAFTSKVLRLLKDLEEQMIHQLAHLLFTFDEERKEKAFSFSFSDCSWGNIVFAGFFLESDRDFNSAIQLYCKLLQLPSGLIENVTDGTNAYLVAIDQENKILASESEIVDAKKRNHIKDIFLIDRPLTAQELSALSNSEQETVEKFLRERSGTVCLNPELIPRIDKANLIIYSPGTQHSSLFPSYLTPNLGSQIAKNLSAIKLLVTNVQEDAEIPDASAVDIIEKAVRYLKEKNRKQIPTPCLITHYLINDQNLENTKPVYVPLGRLENLEDPRMIRIANYEEGITGQHDPEKVLTPFVESILNRRQGQSVAIFLLNTESLNKISQTILEMIRTGIDQHPVSLSVFYRSPLSLAEEFTSILPFPVLNTFSQEEGFKKILQEQNYDYVILFESAGMYVGNDIVNLVSLLGYGRLDAIWGSRRLSIRDISESYKSRYHQNMFLGGISYIGSHLLSFLYLLLYGRYITDTLSGLRAIKAKYLRNLSFDLNDKTFNQQILSLLLKDRADILETPIQFFPISPEEVRRTNIREGLQSILTIVSHRLT